MSSEEAVNTVREIFQSGEPSILKAAEEMIDIALDKGEQFLICSGFFFHLLLSFLQARKTIFPPF
jgi:phosphoserine phosphatase